MFLTCISVYKNMDYTKVRDLTKGNLANRKFIPCGKKVKVTCEKCKGYVICFVEDTIYLCSLHDKVPDVSGIDE